jgi:O-antigen/teichoic acid export membrane protein
MYDQLRRLFRQSAAYTAASMVNRAFAILLVPIYTRFMTQASYGDLALLLGMTAILWVAFDFGISSAVTRFYYDYDDEHARRRYIGSMWLGMTLIAGGISLALTLGGADLLSDLVGDIPFWPYVVLTVWATFLNTANIIPKVLMRVREQSSRYVVVICAQSVLLLVAVLVLVVILDLGLFGAVLALFIQCAAIYVFFTVYTLRNSSFPPDWRAIGRSMMFGLPVIVLEAGWWILDTSDRFILRHYDAARIVALYSVGYALGRLLIMVSTSIDQAWTPFFFAAAKSDDAEARRVASYAATYFTLAVSAMGLLIVVFAREAVLIFGGRAYLEAARVTPVIVMASVVQGLFYVPSRGLLLTKKTKVLPYIVAAAGATNIGLNFLFIPSFGMMGAAVATLLGYVVAVAMTYAFSQHYYRIQYQAGRIGKVLAILVAGTAGAMLMTPSTWYVAVLWKLVILAGAPLALWLSGFFEERELSAAHRLLSRRGIRGVSP